MNDQESIVEKVCTIGSVLLLLYNTSYDYFNNQMLPIDGFLSHPLDYIFTLLPILLSTFHNIIQAIRDGFGDSYCIEYIFRSIITLARVLIEYEIVIKFSLNLQVSLSIEASKWYLGVFFIIFITIVEEILKGFFNENSLEDSIDDFLDHFPYNYILLCFILGLQDVSSYLPFAFEEKSIALFIGLMASSFVFGICEFFYFPFSLIIFWGSLL